MLGLCEKHQSTVTSSSVEIKLGIRNQLIMRGRFQWADLRRIMFCCSSASLKMKENRFSFRVLDWETDGGAKYLVEDWALQVQADHVISTTACTLTSPSTVTESPKLGACPMGCLSPAAAILCLAEALHYGILVITVLDILRDRDCCLRNYPFLVRSTLRSGSISLADISVLTYSSISRSVGKAIWLVADLNSRRDFFGIKDLISTAIRNGR